MSIARSVLAVLGGFFASAVLVVLTDLAIGRPIAGDIAPGSTPGGIYLVVNMALGFASAIVGGWVAGRIAAARPFAHAAGLAALFVVGAVLTGQQPGQPDWYPVAMPALAVIGALIGGKSHERGGG